MIIFNNVNKNYGLNNPVLTNIDLKIKSGELVFFVGEPGSGKTSLLRLITGLDKPSKGQVNVENRILSAISYRGLALARLEMGIIMEEFDLFPNLTLQENIELPLCVKGVEKKEQDKQAQQIINQLGLTQKRHFLACELSCQEKKLAMIERALVTQPNLIVADEPWELLHPELSEKIILKFIELQEKGSTIVIATRQLKVTNDFPRKKRIITLSHGKIIRDETKDRVDKLEGLLDNV